MSEKPIIMTPKGGIQKLGDGELTRLFVHISTFLVIPVQGFVQKFRTGFCFGINQRGPDESRHPRAGVPPKACAR